LAKCSIDLRSDDHLLLVTAALVGHNRAPFLYPRPIVIARPNRSGRGSLACSAATSFMDRHGAGLVATPNAEPGSIPSRRNRQSVTGECRINIAAWIPAQGRDDEAGYAAHPALAFSVVCTSLRSA